MDREQVKWIVERLRAGADARIGGFMNSKLMHEAADALERATWPPSREQIGKALCESEYGGICVCVPNFTVYCTRQPSFLKQIDAILAIKPEKPDV